MIKRSATSGLILMLASALFFAVSNTMIKYISPEIGTWHIACFRFLIGGLILFIVLRTTGLSLRGAHPGLLLLRGITGTLAFLALLKAIQMIPLSHALVLLYTFPLFAAVFSIIFLREPFRVVEMVLAAVGMIGVYVVLAPGSHDLSAGHLFGLIAGCVSGLVMVLIRKLREVNGPFIIYFYYCLIGSAVSLPPTLATLAIYDFRLIAVLIIIAVTAVAAQIFMNEGFRFCKASEGSVILMSEVVFAGAAGVALFDDPLTLPFLIGASLILGSGAVLNFMSIRSRRPV